MQIQVDIPDKPGILSNGLIIQLAGPGESWSDLQLNENRRMQGVYVIHHGDRIRYVGKTDGPTMTFAVRLRREFQHSAAQGKGVYAKLVKLARPPEIKAVFFGPESLAKLVRGVGLHVSDIGMIRITEQAFIDAYGPDFQAGEN